MPAELRTRVKYTRVDPVSSCESPYAQLDTQGFSKYQVHASDKPTERHYDGGRSTLALRSVRKENTPLSIMYFSKENTDYLQQKVKRVVLRRSRGKIILGCDQDEFDFLLNMRAVYLQYARDIPTATVQQVLDLNERFIEYVVPDIITNSFSKQVYLKDISNPIVPIALPVNVSKRGRKTLQSVMR